VILKLTSYQIQSMLVGWLVIHMKSDTMNDKNELIGKRAKIQFPDVAATVEYRTTTSLHWKTTDKAGATAKADETINYERVAPHLHFLNWIEKDGWTVSQIIDTEKHSVRAFWSFEDEKSDRGHRSSVFIAGTIEFIE
jgi:hypothetical protein